MGRARLYILKMLLKTLTVTSLAVTAIACLIYSQRYIGDIVERAFPASMFLEIVLALTPTLLVAALPVTLGISIVFIYAKLIADSEVLVLRAAGVSQMGLLAPAAILAIGAMAVSYAMTLYFIPDSYNRFKELENMVRSGEVAVSLPAQTFNSLDEDITIFYARSGAEGVMEQILVHDSRRDEEPLTVVADRAVVNPADGRYRIVFWDGSLQRFDRTRNRLATVSFEQYVLEVDLGGAPAIDPDRSRSTSELPMDELIDEAMAAAEPERRADALVELYQRLTSPLLTLTVALIAIATLFAGEQVRTRFTRRVMLVGLQVTAVLVAFQWVMGAARGTPSLLPLLPAIAIAPGLIALAVLIASDRHGPGYWRRKRRFGAQASSEA